MKPKILMVDDNESFIRLFLSMHADEAHDYVTFTTIDDAIAHIDAEEINLVLSDVNFPEDEKGGIRLSDYVQDNHPEIPVILLTSFGSVENAVDAVKRGAFHYFEKPIEDEKADLLRSTIREALEKNRIQKEVARFEKVTEIRNRLRKPPIIGKSDQIKAVKFRIGKLSEVDVNVLITGETGTGKELVARQIHASSTRRNRLFLPVNCCQHNEGILESELFGHKKGAFSGAIEDKAGIFEAVDGGVLFLDEIFEASPALQAKLLRVLEDKMYTPLGTVKAKRSDFRLIAGTNKFLENEVKAGTFREDLYFRLKVGRIHVPPLRDRKEDIPLIAEFYLKAFNKEYRRDLQGFTENAYLNMAAYDWPGNVRELVHAIQHAFIYCRDERITTADLFPDVRSRQVPDSLKLADIEKFYIGLVLKICDNNKTRASEMLGISRKTVIDKIKKYGLE